MSYKNIPPLLGTFICVVLVTACSITGRPLTPTDLVEIREQGKPILLLRFVVEEPDGTPIKPFAHLWAHNNLQLGLGDFDTGGFPKKQLLFWFLPGDARDQGWIYLPLTPGTYYLAVRPAGMFLSERGRYIAELLMFKSWPRWFIDIPAGASVVYGGSLYFVGEGTEHIFGGDRVDWLDAERSQIRNQEAQAKKLAAEHLGDLGPFTTVLMERHKTDTFILRTPSR